VNITENCDLVAVLFFGAIALAVIGNLVGLAAWRQRAADQDKWRWFVDPSYLMRSANFVNPRAPTRFLALALLVLGATFLAVLVGAVIAAQRAGTTAICGFML
jgi:hypothetical protein